MKVSNIVRAFKRKQEICRLVKNMNALCTQYLRYLYSLTAPSANTFVYFTIFTLLWCSLRASFDSRRLRSVCYKLPIFQRT